MSDLPLTTVRKIATRLREQSKDGRLNQDDLERVSRKTGHSQGELIGVARDIGLIVDLPTRTTSPGPRREPSPARKNGFPLSDVVRAQIENAGIFRRLSPPDREYSTC